MSGFKDIMKDGWHPKSKDGKKESWRNDFKGINQVAGWMGKGKDDSSDRSEHVSQPLSSMKDPSAWGPPPKHINYHGPAAVPNQNTPDRSGLGAPLSQQQVRQQNARVEQQQAELEAEEEQAQAPAVPPVPYRADRTGLSTNNLPPPPRRVDSPADAGPPVSSRPKPSIPPRVPPRTNSTPPSHTPSPPPAYSPIQPTESSDGYINQGATARLTRAGVSVPSLGIGGNSPRTTGSVSQSPVNQLQSRFSQMKTSSPAPPPPPRRDTLPEKPAASQTQNSHNDVSSPSTSSSQGIRSTVSDLRERHGDKIQAGKDKVSGFNEKYQISQRAKNFIDEKKANHTSAPSSGPPIPRDSNQPASSVQIDTDTLSRKKPPPPPPKKSGMRALPVNTSAPGSPVPPPIPTSTKPR
ncbi:hypothetical protein ASPWEDRAFT_171606 [Aspergillus wentii DTO 134E9]|uniref:Uncharacterized protein n=1 Tax=Aspergillus wentii DTO 134E9 TaxID=1073089 RepID=A0A1L9RIL2_ASPWE|nr:uncharacterized protein ASPWEDRAFT_171606 [Aspergillus wentii DTO 134E9]KAI9932268.1 hypothetical protein MW887_009779 [Aspergillus wentii]OJJ34770.1 hypothetical protein ASPWEDRAFT_171606 [Aspergillus wentii DTO 134E9]